MRENQTPSNDICMANANPNILTHHQPRNAANKQKFLQSVKEKIEYMDAQGACMVALCSEVPNAGQNVLRVVWSHRKKTTPSGEIYQHRSCICADGSQQTTGVDFTDNYTIVVLWTTVWFLLILVAMIKNISSGFSQ